MFIKDLVASSWCSCCCYGALVNGVYKLADRFVLPVEFMSWIVSSRSCFRCLFYSRRNLTTSLDKSLFSRFFNDVHDSGYYWVVIK